jgi:hypothetical protein
MVLPCTKQFDFHTLTVRTMRRPATGVILSSCRRSTMLHHSSRWRSGGHCRLASERTRFTLRSDALIEHGQTDQPLPSRRRQAALAIRWHDSYGCTAGRSNTRAVPVDSCTVMAGLGPVISARTGASTDGPDKSGAMTEDHWFELLCKQTTRALLLTQQR